MLSWLKGRMAWATIKFLESDIFLKEIFLSDSETLISINLVFRELKNKNPDHVVGSKTLPDCCKIIFSKTRQNIFKARWNFYRVIIDISKTQVRVISALGELKREREHISAAVTIKNAATRLALTRPRDSQHSCVS